MDKSEKEEVDEATNGRSLTTSIKSFMKKSFSCDGGCRQNIDLRKTIVGYFPVWKHIRTYKWRQCLVNDIIAGMSVGVVQVPQGMGFALMAGLPPVYGLYSSIVPSWLYYLFGTSRHLSLGTMALIALMVGAVVGREDLAAFGERPDGVGDRGAVGSVTAGPYNLSVMEMMEATTESTTDMSIRNSSAPLIDAKIREEYRVGVAVSLTLLVGLCQLIMRLLRLGVLASHMSSSFVEGFMSGAAVHIVVSQIPFLLGLRIPRPAGSYFQVPRVLYNVAKNILHVNLCALGASAVSIAIILSIRHLNEKFKSRMRAPIPAELLVVILGTTVSHFAWLEDRCSLAVIGPVPLGLPGAAVPPFTNWQNYITDAPLIAVVGFAIALTMGKLMATKHKYEIDSNQELLSYGIINVVGPFFGTFAATPAPPRTLLMSSSGGKTQLAGFISTFLPLCVCLFLGPLFYSLPVSILGSTVFTALLPLVIKIHDAPALWRVNQLDFINWLVTFCATVFLSVTVGLISGMMISLLLFVVQAQLVKGSATVQINHDSNDKEFLIEEDKLTAFANGSADNPKIRNNIDTSVSDPKKYSSSLQNLTSSNINSKISQNNDTSETNDVSINEDKMCAEERDHVSDIEREARDRETNKGIVVVLANNTSDRIHVFKFETSLFFANAERFKSELYRCTVDPVKIRKSMKKKRRKGHGCCMRLGRNSGQVEINIPDEEANMKKSNTGEVLWSMQKYQDEGDVKTISLKDFSSQNGQNHSNIEIKTTTGQNNMKSKFSNSESSSKCSSEENLKLDAESDHMIISSRNVKPDLCSTGEVESDNKTSSKIQSDFIKCDDGQTEVQALDNSAGQNSTRRLSINSVSNLLPADLSNIESQVENKLDAQNASQIIDLEEIMSKPTDKPKYSTVVQVDCTGMTYVDVTGLSALCQIKEELTEVGVKLEAINYNREFARKARLVGLKDILR